MGCNLGLDMGCNLGCVFTRYLPNGGQSGEKGNIYRPGLFRPFRRRISVFRAPVQDIQRAAAPSLYDARTVENIGDNGIPRPGLMGSGQFFRSDAEVKGAGIGNLKMIIIHGHGHGAARNGVIPVAQGIGQGLACGARWICGLVFAHHLPSTDGCPQSRPDGLSP